MKLFVAYKEGADESAFMNTKFTVPKSWRPGPVAKLLEFSVQTYNSKHPAAPLALDAVHFELKGEALGLEDIVQEVLETKDEVLIKPGASKAVGAARQAALDAEAKRAAEVEAKRKFAIGKVKCQNFGCAQLFDPNNNPEGSCKHHTGPPFFHDCNKGWTCCRGKTAMDWDDFQKLPTCAVGRHSAEKPKAPPKCSPAAPPPACLPTKTISGYNASDEGKSAATGAKGFAKATGTKAKPKVTRYDDGTYRCQNKGCQAKFDPEANNAQACRYHSGTPVFHETLKWWGCCATKKKMDFDDFLAVPGCQIGPHWNGEGDPPVVCPPCPAAAGEVVEAGENGFDLG